MHTKYEELIIRSAHLSEEERAKGLITASAGNHAQGVAYAAKALWMQGNDCYADSHTADQGKPYQRAMAQKLFFTEMSMMMHVQMPMSLQKSTDILLYIRLMIWTVATGQGTIAMEIVQELPTVDYILVPIGGGGLITGVSTLAKMLNPKIKVIGVEPADAASMTGSHRSRQAGDTSTVPTRSQTVLQ